MLQIPNNDAADPHSPTGQNLLQAGFFVQRPAIEQRQQPATLVQIFFDLLQLDGKQARSGTTRNQQVISVDKDRNLIEEVSTYSAPTRILAYSSLLLALTLLVPSDAAPFVYAQF